MRSGRCTWLRAANVRLSRTHSEGDGLVERKAPSSFVTPLVFTNAFIAQNRVCDFARNLGTSCLTDTVTRRTTIAGARCTPREIRSVRAGRFTNGAIIVIVPTTSGPDDNRPGSASRTNIPFTKTRAGAYKQRSKNRFARYSDAVPARETARS